MSRKPITTEQFISKSKFVHGDKYDYDLVKYSGCNTKVKIVCLVCDHGEFLQLPRIHLEGCGCQKCSNKYKPTTEEYIELAKLSHPDKNYGYDLVKYTHRTSKVKIICPVEGHGVFEQRADSHLNGSGCKKCFSENQEGNYQLKLAIQGHYKGSGYLYIIRMFNEKELFVKIGVSKKIKQRLNTIKYQSKYNIEKLKTIFFKDFNEAIIEENSLHDKHKEYSYIPKNKFGGWTECFNLNDTPIDFL